MRLSAITALLIAYAILQPAKADPPQGSGDAPSEERVLIVRPGDTLARLLDSAGVEDAAAAAAIARLGTLFRPTALRPGDEVAIRVTTTDPAMLLEIEVEPEPGRTIRARRQTDGTWQADQVLAPRQRFLVRAEGIVDGGLFPAMTRAGVPAGLALSLIRILGHQVDFQRDLQPGNRFAILFERYRDAEGDILGHGQTLRARLVLSNRTIDIWRHKDARGSADWYDQDGRSLRRSFLRTPLDGARVSSGFGMRSHPVLGFNRMHQGIDFAAPTGTRVYAAADGTVVSAKRDGGYGLMVRLRHAGGVETRYAHLSRFTRGLASGRRVRQGDVIGAVGSTGLSTGPHLHYEVVVAGRAVNPARHVQQATRLGGAELATFRTRQRHLDRLAATLGQRDEVAFAID
jgi:murein DD-endopeptidase MepM/ murein hydrolase activator NlpD